MTTAILAVQGAFIEHQRVLEQLGESCALLRGPDDLQHDFDRLVLPGGESTVQGKLLAEQDMLEPLRQRVIAGLPVLATCAGLILLAEQVEDEGAHPIPRFGTLPARVRRNAYGRQLGSFQTTVDFTGLGLVAATFIRAPQVVEVGEGVEVLASHDGVPVAVRCGSQLACSFHPELGFDTRVHKLFLAL